MPFRFERRRRDPAPQFAAVRVPFVASRWRSSLSSRQRCAATVARRSLRKRVHRRTESRLRRAEAASTPERFFQAIVKVQTRAVPDARSSDARRRARGHRHRHRRRRARPHDRLPDHRGRSGEPRRSAGPHAAGARRRLRSRHRTGTRARRRAARGHAAALRRIVEPRRARSGDDRQSRRAPPT